MLREDARRYVRATLIEDGEAKYEVAVKLKGAAGSFQGLDDKPGFTLNMGKFQKDQTFHALHKFHLNNSVQDESYLCEGLCGVLCREAGVPAARVTHARVWLGDRDLGLYVLKEGFDLPFLKRHFADPKGNLYDGGFCIDIDAELEKDSGEGPNDLSDLKALLAACQEPEPEQRWRRVAEQLDVEAFLNFMALELMCCHWDGYVYNKNNYRIYFDPATQKARFLPHGMDQMFQDPGFPLFADPGPIVSQTVMQNPAWRERYRERIKQLLPLFTGESLREKVDELDRPLAAVINSMSEEAAQQHAEVVRQLKERLVARAENIREQLAQPDPGPSPPPQPPAPLEFNEDGIADLPADWYPGPISEGAVLEPEEVDGEVHYKIACGPTETCIASWRRRVLVPQGKYQFEAELRTSGVAALEDEKGRGAGLRISGTNRENELNGDEDWTPLGYEFNIEEPQAEIELVAELRATAGKLWLKSARLRKVE
jgi:hypothetical protein